MTSLDALRRQQSSRATKGNHITHTNDSGQVSWSERLAGRRIDQGKTALASRGRTLTKSWQETSANTTQIPSIQAASNQSKAALSSISTPAPHPEFDDALFEDERNQNSSFPSGKPQLMRRPTLSEGLRQSSAEVQRLQDKLDKVHREISSKDSQLLLKDVDIRKHKEEVQRLREAAQGKTLAQQKLGELEISFQRTEQELKRVRNTLKLTTSQLQHTQSRLAQRTAELEEQKAINMEVQQVSLEDSKTTATGVAAVESATKISKSSESLEAPLNSPDRDARKKMQLDKESSNSDTSATISSLQANRVTLSNSTSSEQLQATIDIEKRKAENLQIELENVRERLHSSEESHITSQKQTELQIEALKSQVRQKEEQLRHAFQSIKQQELAKDSEKQELRYEKRRLQARLQDLEAQLDSRLKAVDIERLRTQASDKTVAELSEELSRAKAAQDRTRREVERLSHSLSTECAKTTSLSEHLNRALEESKEWAKKYQAVVEQTGLAADLQCSLEKTKKLLLETTEKLEALESHNESTQKSFQAELQMTKSKASKEAQEYLKQCSDLEEDLKIVKEKNKLLEQEYQNAIQESKMLKVALQDEESQHTNLKRSSVQEQKSREIEYEAERVALAEELARVKETSMATLKEVRAENREEVERVRQLSLRHLEETKDKADRVVAEIKNVSSQQLEQAKRDAMVNLKDAKEAFAAELNQVVAKSALELAQVKSDAAKALEMSEKESARAREEDAQKSAKAIASLQSELNAELTQAQAQARAAEAETASLRKELEKSLEHLRAESQETIAALQGRAESWRAKAERAERSLEQKEHEVKLARTDLARRSSEMERLAELQKIIEHRAEDEGKLKEVLVSVREQMDAHKAMLNLRLLLKSADATDAVTHLEFARVKEKNLEQQLQVLVYNITACESHMIQCDPAATQKQQITRMRRLEKLESQLDESAKNRNDYLNTSKTNRERLTQLLHQAETRLGKAQVETLEKLPSDVRKFWS